MIHHPPSIRSGGLIFQIDTVELRRFENAMAAAGHRTEPAIRKAVNQTGGVVRTAVVNSLTTQTGLAKKVIVKAVKARPATPGNLSFALITRGGDIALKYFKPRETRKGVSAYPWGKLTRVDHAFLKGGAFPNRKTLAMGGHVFRRVGSGRKIIAIADTGVFIPKEMVEGATAATFNRVAERELMPRIATELYRIIGGAR